jgi:hypothetical protein
MRLIALAIVIAAAALGLAFNCSYIPASEVSESSKVVESFTFPYEPGPYSSLTGHPYTRVRDVVTVHRIPASVVCFRFGRR